MIRATLKEEREARTHEVAEEAKEAHRSHDSRKLFALVKELSPKTEIKVKTLKDDDGVPIVTPKRAAEQWRHFFARKLAGMVCSLQALQLSTASRLKASVDQLPLELQVDDVMSPADLKALFNDLKDGKGHGPDSIPAELYKYAPLHILLHMHTLILKCLARVEEPIRWKGTCLSQLYKGSGDPGACDSHRGICVSDTAAKIYHLWLRRRSIGALEAVLPDGFFGGFKKRGTDFCALQAREIWAYAKMKSLAAGQLYIDIIGAFDAVVRQLLMGRAAGDDLTDLEVASVLRALGFYPAELQEIIKLIPEVSYLQSLGTSPNIAAAVKESHEASWYVMQGSSITTRTRVGSKPGDPLGDMIFNYMAHKLRIEIDGQLKQHGMFDAVPVPSPDVLDPSFVQEGLLLKGATYIDDDSFPAFARTSAELVAKFKSIITIISTAYRRHGMALNLKENKTELLLRLTGQGSRDARSTLAADGCIQFPAGLLAADTPSFSVKVSRAYKHMGSMVTVDLQPHDEIKARSGHMFNAMRPLRRKVLSNPRLPLEMKTGMVTTLLHSRLLYNAGTWPKLTPKLFGKLSHAYITPYRAAAAMMNGPEQNKFSDYQVIEACKIPTVYVALIRARCKLFVRLCRFAPVPLLMLVLALVDEHTSWMHEVRRNMADIHKASPDLCDMPSPMESLSSWVAAIKDDPNKIKRFLAKGAALLSMPSPAVPVAPPPLEFKCEDCSLAYHTKDALMTHRYRRHGYRNPMFYKVKGTLCMVCNKDYYNTPRLLKHLCFGSGTCKAGYTHMMPLLTQADRDDNFVPSVRKGKHLLPPPKEMW